LNFKLPYLSLLLFLGVSINAQNTDIFSKKSSSNYSDTTTVWGRDQIDSLVKDIRALFDELLDVEVGYAAVQTRFISNVGYGLDNAIGLNRDLRDTFEVLRKIVQSEFFVKSALKYDHLYARWLNRKKYSPKDNELENQFGDDVYANQIYFDVNFYPAWDTVKMNIDAAREAKAIAWKCIIDVHGLGEFKAEFSQAEMDTIVQTIVNDKKYTNIGREGKPDVNQGIFTSLGWLAEKFGFKPFDDPTNIKRVDFYAPVAGDNSFDKYDNKGILAGNYDNISVKGMQYFVPWKSLQATTTSTDTIKAVVSLKTSGKPSGDTLEFVTTKGTKLNAKRQNDTVYLITPLPALNKEETGDSSCKYQHTKILRCRT
jgi:hypothetical protein